MKLWPSKPNYTKKLRKTQAKYNAQTKKLRRYVNRKIEKYHDKPNSNKYKEYKEMANNFEAKKGKHQTKIGRAHV